ncbi:MAG: ribonuclease HII [Gammaproteobacteria bacterium]|nr:ribonuclease HII [Gammaproteobacteria bacterium]
MTGAGFAGVDEAGRGPLAGRVYAAAVILGTDPALAAAVGDSKKLSPARRETLDLEIRRGATAFGIAWCSAAEIDELNILHATMLAMRRAVEALSRRPERVLVDGNRCPELPVSSEAVVGGDASVPAIGAASILAKVARDRYMCELDQRYPGYGFARHKGYPTRQHLEALEQLGPCPEHRRSFRPVAVRLSAGKTGEESG